jgi:hypothetical protein
MQKNEKRKIGRENGDEEGLKARVWGNARTPEWDAAFSDFEVKS